MVDLPSPAYPPLPYTKTGLTLYVQSDKRSSSSHQHGSLTLLLSISRLLGPSSCSSQKPVPFLAPIPIKPQAGNQQRPPLNSSNSIHLSLLPPPPPPPPLRILVRRPFHHFP
eukprot:TRINITY_DN2047_c0_g1_i4.p3 TRINITY_DN2047_c0_g1~~TRINITY_DN2047_c0_g1_i4.p3  ORF type:complete len:112 (-),score=12.31 TRINITY_DN2047_c0_g1_i4:1045-1380(-)